MTKYHVISVVIPCFNVEPYIKECIQSVLEQDIECQIICVDNGSTDNTVEVIRSIQKDHPVELLFERKKGASAARNKGLAACTGEWVQFLDADDLLIPGKFEDQVSIANKRVAVVVADYHRQKISGEKVLVEVHEDPWKGLFTTRAGITSSALFRRKLVESVDGWNESLFSSQEYDLMFRLAQKGHELAIVRKPLAIVRDRESGQISQSDPLRRWTKYLGLRVEIMNFIRNFLPEYWAKEKRWYETAFFDMARFLAPYDLDGAHHLIRKQLGRRFIPGRSKTTGWKFIFFYWLLGYKRAEKLRLRKNRN